MIGDSTLDNVVWLKDSQKCIKFLIANKNPEFEVQNYAADGFTSEDIINGDIPKISMSFRERIGDPYPKFEKIFKPLEALK